LRQIEIEKRSRVVLVKHGTDVLYVVWLLPDDGDGLLPVVNLTSTDIARGDESEPAQQGCPLLTKA
jgi:hypothetical protein